MRQYGNTLKASSGKVIYRKNEPDNYFHGCTLLEGETKDNFGEIPETSIPDHEEYPQD